MFQKSMSRSLLGGWISALVVIAVASSFCSAAEGKHDHAEKGPHGGPLIELGDEEYHAELLLAEKEGVVTIHVLDSKAKSAVAIEAKEILINLKHGKKPVQFRLKASASEGDPEGKSSKFVLKNPELIEDLHHKETSAQLRLSIEGKSYSGKILLEDDHDHNHGEKKEKS